VLAQSEVAQYLLRNRLVSAECFVNGELSITEASRRNRNYKVICRPGTSYLLKQGDGESGAATVAHESKVYGILDASPEGISLQPYLPRCHGYDAGERILILELLSDARDFREHHLRRGRFPAGLAAELGAALSTLHRLPAAAFTGNGADFGTRIPWVLSLHRPGLTIFRDASNANLQLIRILQNTPGFPEMLDALREGWRVDSLIHNDIKWDNCLVPVNPARENGSGLKIVDWEFARLGDSAWDAGAIFSNYLSVWLFSIPVSGEEPPERFLDLALFPLERMQPAMRAYWETYAGARNFDPTRTSEFLLRAVRYAAARLVQTGFEHMQHSTFLTGNLVCLLQLSLNIMQRPREAIAHLLGIPLAHSAGQAR